MRYAYCIYFTITIACIAITITIIHYFRKKKTLLHIAIGDRILKGNKRHKIKTAKSIRNG